MRNTRTREGLRIERAPTSGKAYCKVPDVDTNFSWPFACSLLASFTTELSGVDDHLAGEAMSQLFDLTVVKQRFPSLAKSPVSLDDSSSMDLCRNSLNDLFMTVLSHFPKNRTSKSRLLQLISEMCRGNLRLLWKQTFDQTLQIVLNELNEPPASTSSQRLELIHSATAALAALVYLYPVEYRSTGESLKKSCPTTGRSKHSDLLDGNATAYSDAVNAAITHLASVHETRASKHIAAHEAIELSCLHALVQLLCHRRIGVTNGFPSLDATQTVRAVQALWPSVCCSGPDSLVATNAKPPPLSQEDVTTGETEHGYSTSTSTDFSSSCDGDWQWPKWSSPSKSGFPAIVPTVPVTESETDDPESSAEDSRLGVNNRSAHSQEARVRKKICLLATFCVRRIVNCTTKRICLDLWPCLMPESQSFNTMPSSERRTATSVGQSGLQPDLLTLILKQRDPRMRQIFIEMLGNLLTNTESRFSVAEELTVWHSTAYIPYAVRLAAELRALHRRICWALLSESSPQHQLCLLRAVNALVAVTPYQRLRPGLLSDLLPSLNKFLFISSYFSPTASAHEPTRRTHFQSAVLTVWSTVLGKSTAPILEICQLLWAEPNSMNNSLRKETEEGQKDDNGACESPSGGSPLHHLSTVSGRNYAAAFSPCWLVEYCLRLIHPSVADLAWDAKPPSEEAVKVNSGAFEAHYSASGTLVQANQLRLQAFATLIHFMPHYYECLRPSMPLILKTIRLCLRPELKENKPLQYNLLRLCDGLLSRLKCQATGRSAEKEPTAGQTAKIEDCSDAADTNTRELLVWWAETVGLILENLTINSEASECWWSCQVFGVFFETLFVSRTTEVGSAILKPVVAILKRISTFRSGGVQAKALRTLFGICVNQKCVVAESLLSSSMDFLVGLSANLPPLVGTDVAYCVELSTVKALNSQGRLNINWNIQSLIHICLSLCSCPTSETLPVKRREKGRNKLTDGLDFQTDGCCNSDARRCEHSLHSLANFLELMSYKQIQRAPDDVFVTILQTFASCLHVKAVSGAEKVRWNAALATSKVLGSQYFVSMIPSYQPAEENTLFSLVSALCKALLVDPYFKVKVHAALSLLLLFGDTLNGSLIDSVHDGHSEHHSFPALPFCDSIMTSLTALLSTDFSTRSSEEGCVVVSGLNRNESQHRTACLFLCSLLLLRTAIYSLVALTVDNFQGAMNCLKILASALSEPVKAVILKNHLKNVFSQAIAASTAGPLIFGRAKLSTSCCYAEATPGEDGGEVGNVSAVVVSFAGRNSALKNFDFQNALPSAFKAVKTFSNLVASVDLTKLNATELRAFAEALSSQSASFLREDAHGVPLLSQNSQLSNFRTVYD